MKAIVTTLALFFTAVFASAANEDWATDLEAALAKAKKENKNVLVEFTGADWCPACKKIDKEVFTKKEFTSAASEDFVLVMIDIPESNKPLQEKNNPVAVAKSYDVEAYPTVILFDAEGKEYSRFFATKYPTIDKFLAHLKKVKKVKK